VYQTGLAVTWAIDPRCHQALYDARFDPAAA